MASTQPTRRHFLTLAAIGLGSAMTGCVNGDHDHYPDHRERREPVRDRDDWRWNHPKDGRWHDRNERRERERDAERHGKNRRRVEDRDERKDGREAELPNDGKQNGNRQNRGRQNDGKKRDDEDRRNSDQQHDNGKDRGRDGKDEQPLNQDQNHRRERDACPSDRPASEACRSTDQQRPSQ